MPTPRRKSRVRKHEELEAAEVGGTLRPDEMAPDVLEFITAIDHYKRAHRRPFPNWSEVLSVLKGLGYVRPRAPSHPAGRAHP